MNLVKYFPVLLSLLLLIRQLHRVACADDIFSLMSPAVSGDFETKPAWASV